MAIKDSVLNALQSRKGDFLSGEELSADLAVSRTAVWKAIKSLREEGYPIEAATNKGYMLMQDTWLITEESLRLSMPPQYRNNKILIYDTLDSTNTQAKKLALEKVPHGTVVMARQQTGGRGRLGRSFFSPREGIYISIIIKPSFDLTKSVLVTSAVAVAVAEAIENVCGKDARIKWVNDVYVDNKKVCGILTEGINDFETGTIEYLVIGAGINTTLKDFPPSLLDTVGAVEGNYSKSSLAANVIGNIMTLTDNLQDRSFIKAYKEKSLVLGKTIKVYKGGYPANEDGTALQLDGMGIPARVLDIDEDGGLVVLYSNGTQEALKTGEISIRL